VPIETHSNVLSKEWAQPLLEANALKDLPLREGD
jgi:hypothetical protein